MNSKEQSLIFIIFSILTFWISGMGILMLTYVFDNPDEDDSMSHIFYLVCGFMILISTVGLLYGVNLRQKNKSICN